jgi:hypothetical protein
MELPNIRTVDEPAASTGKSSHARGRPRRVDAPIVPWDEVDRRFGENSPPSNFQQSYDATAVCGKPARTV